MEDKDKEKKNKAAPFLILGGLAAGIAALVCAIKAKAAPEEPEEPEEPPEGMANLCGVVLDSLSGERIQNVRVVLDGHTIQVECEFYNPQSFGITLSEGINARDIDLSPVLLAGVVIGARTKASNPDLDEPSGSYKSRLTFNGGMLGDDYISNGSSYRNNTINLVNNPETQEAWRESDLYTNEFGVWLWASAWTPAEYPSTRCTQVWVQAFYLNGDSVILRPYSGDGWNKVDEVSPDEDQSYISHTTSGGMIPWAGRDFSFKVK
jgi:hypothetical protein